MSFTHLIPGVQEHDIISSQVFLHELARDLFDLGRNGRGSFKHPSQPSSPAGWAPVRKSQSWLRAAACSFLSLLPRAPLLGTRLPRGKQGLTTKRPILLEQAKRRGGWASIFLSFSLGDVR